MMDSDKFISVCWFAFYANKILPSETTQHLIRNFSVLLPAVFFIKFFTPLFFDNTLTTPFDKRGSDLNDDEYDRQFIIKYCEFRFKRMYNRGYIHIKKRKTNIKTPYNPASRDLYRYYVYILSTFKFIYNRFERRFFCQKWLITVIYYV